MWALVESGTVTQTFNELPSKLTVSNRNYDKAELTAMSDSERKAIGIYPVATAAKLDAKFYIEKPPTYVVNGDKVDETIVKASDLPLADSNKVDDDGNPINDYKGNQEINEGLKTIYKRKTNQNATALISVYNWLVERYTYDNSKTIPTAVKTYVAAVRTAATTINGKIDGASDMTAFSALFVVPKDGSGNPTGNAPIEDWPDDYDVRSYRR
tara:strand:+ start:2626 stop:3261 length:636 start_codon:yes stop_codon:yes gene_type:complete